MLKFWEKILWFLFVISIIALVICVIWSFVEMRSLPLWLVKSIVFYNILFAIYYTIKKKRNE